MLFYATASWIEHGFACTIPNKKNTHIRPSYICDIIAGSVRLFYESLQFFFFKLMNRESCSNYVAQSIGTLFSRAICLTSFRFGQFFSFWTIFSLECGVRLEGVLSPHLFNVNRNDVIKTVSQSNYCCNIYTFCTRKYIYVRIDDLIADNNVSVYVVGLIKKNYLHL